MDRDCHAQGNTKDEISESTKPEDATCDALSDVGDSDCNTNSGSCREDQLGEYVPLEPRDSRSLDSIFQYTNKIRAFAGLSDSPPPKEETLDVDFSKDQQLESAIKNEEHAVNGKHSETLNCQDSGSPESNDCGDDAPKSDTLIPQSTQTDEIGPSSSDKISNIEQPKSLENSVTENEDNFQPTEHVCRDHSCVETQQTPCTEGVHRLSMEIATKVLNTASTQLRDMLGVQKSMQNKEISSKVEAALSDSKSNLGNAKKNDSTTCLLSENNHHSAHEYVPEQSKEDKNVNKEIQLKDVLAKTYDNQAFQKKIELEMNQFDPRFDVDPDTVCGIGSFKPEWIQPWATERVYLVLYSIIGILSGSYYSYLIGSLSTLEKRFAFKSKVSGSIMMLDEITPLLLGVLIGYFGGKSHRPRMVGFGMLLSSLCCFVTAMPYFIYGPATHLSTLSGIKNETRLELCDGDVRKDNCDAEDLPPTSAAVFFLMLGSFMKGFGNLAYYAIGLAYMDDNAKKRNTPLYFAIAFALRLLGPMVGFLMSSFFLKYYENPFGDPGFGPEDPRWIGGWWMGFCLQGILLLFFTVPISLFPRRLPGHKPNSYSKDEIGSSKISDSFAGLFLALKRLAKNPLFILINLNTIMAIFGHFGHYIMLPKYMENQFRLSASDASLLSGPPGIAAIIISTLIGGYLIWRFKPSARVLIAGMVVLDSISAIGFLLLMIPKCKNIEMAHSGWNNNGLILEDACNVNCNCTTEDFNPVCGSDGSTLFFSPCFAGCQQDMNQTFSNCSCVSNPLAMEKDFVTKGLCFNEECWSQALAYIITMPCLQIVVSMLKVAHTMLLLRSIDPADKSVALGVFETLICAFGFIPYPVLFGSLVDSACLVWEKSCGQTGNCWFYDVPKFNYLLHGASFLFTALSAITLFAIYFLNGRVHDLYEDDDDFSTSMQKKPDAVAGSVKEVKNTTKM